MLLSSLAVPTAAPAAATAIRGLCDKCSGHMQPCLDQLMALYAQVGLFSSLVYGMCAVRVYGSCVQLCVFVVAPSHSTHPYIYIITPRPGPQVRRRGAPPRRRRRRQRGRQRAARRAGC
jgi:hypothetical protein